MPCTLSCAGAADRQRWEGELHPHVEAVHVLEVGIVLLDPRQDGLVGDTVHFPRHLCELLPFLHGAHDHRRRLGDGGTLSGLQQGQGGAGRARRPAVTFP